MREYAPCFESCAADSVCIYRPVMHCSILAPKFFFPTDFISSFYPLHFSTVVCLAPSIIFVNIAFVSLLFFSVFELQFQTHTHIESEWKIQRSTLLSIRFDVIVVFCLPNGTHIINASTTYNVVSQHPHRYTYTAISSSQKQAWFIRFFYSNDDSHFFFTPISLPFHTNDTISMFLDRLLFFFNLITASVARKLRKNNRNKSYIMYL